MTTGSAVAAAAHVGGYTTTAGSAITASVTTAGILNAGHSSVAGSPANRPVRILSVPASSIVAAPGGGSATAAALSPLLPSNHRSFTHQYRVSNQSATAALGTVSVFCLNEVVFLV